MQSCGWEVSFCYLVNLNKYAFLQHLELELVEYYCIYFN